MNPGQLKICCQKILPQHQNEYNFIQKTKETHSDIYHQKLKAAFYATKLWPKNAIIKIGFLNTNPNIPKTNYNYTEIYNKLDPLQNIFDTDNTPIIDSIKKIVNERIQPLVNLKIQFIKNPFQANIRIDFNPDIGCWSLIGTDCLNISSNEATMNFAWFDVATIIHEFGHALGMIHEHQSPFNNPIEWDKEKLYDWAQETQGWDEEQTNQQIINKYNQTELNGSNFDSKSIMLYFYPPILTLNNKGTTQNVTLSALDVLWIYKSYPINSDINNLDIPKEFYKKVYNLDFNEAIKNSETYISNKPSQLYYLIIGISIIIILIFIFLLFQK
jgi:hypothetical protein